MLLPLLPRLRHLAVGLDLRFDGRSLGDHEGRTSLRSSGRRARASRNEIRSSHFRNSESRGEERVKGRKKDEQKNAKS